MSDATAPPPRAYWCEVAAEGPVYGTGETRTYVLGTYQTISPVLALRWLRGEARRIADRLDPDPECSAWVRPSMRTAEVPVPDCPAELRVWAADAEDARAEREHIKQGERLDIVVPDVDCRYTFRVCPVPVPSRPGNPSVRQCPTGSTPGGPRGSPSCLVTVLDDTRDGDMLCAPESTGSAVTL